ncbi:MAG TPA: hypothetical protein VGG29_06355 [Caulobacteraceae bacterium]|jgi:hypothetical protein
MKSGAWAGLLLALCAAGLGARAGTRLAPPTVGDAQALTARLAADLAAEPSATAVLQRWCARQSLADPPRIVAKRDLAHDKPATAAVRGLLRAAPDEPIRYRKVALACGRHLLSRADNWYRPDRLTAQMNAELDSTDHPFGAVVRPLDFHRESLEAKVLLQPGALRVPAAIIRNKALLETPDGTPFSLVVETYSKAILDQGVAAPPRVRSLGRVSTGRKTRAPKTVVVVVGAARSRHHPHFGPRRPRAHLAHLPRVRRRR